MSFNYEMKIAQQTQLAGFCCALKFNPSMWC